MHLNDLLRLGNLNPGDVLVFRHRPSEPELNKVLPWLAAEEPDVFNAYQQTQGERLERSMEPMVGAGHVASFIGHQPAKALFVGLYSISGARPLSPDEFWRVPAFQRMKEFGMRGWVPAKDGRRSILWFDLRATDFYSQWKGRLVIGWPPPERSWWRRAHKNDFPVLAVLEDSALAPLMPAWEDLHLAWSDLAVLPMSWRSALSEWRGVYYIFDASDGKAYVGSAYAEGNLLSRWLNYAADGHGGNRLLRGRDPRHFRFSILQRVSPDMEPKSVIGLESSWKERLHTRQPFGLNDN